MTTILERLYGARKLLQGNLGLVEYEVKKGVQRGGLLEVKSVQLALAEIESAIAELEQADNHFIDKNP